MKKELIIIFLIILIDQFLKRSLNHILRNYGASFNILEGYKLILIIISLIALIIFIYLFIKEKDKIPFSLLIAGTTSNLIDRLLLGYVVDYINLFNLFNFNLADLSNTIGIIILILKTWKK